MKKIITIILLTALMLVCFASCSDETDDNNKNTDTTYVDESEVTSASGTYDTSATGAGTDVDNWKVVNEIGSYEYSDFAKTDEVTDYVVIKVKNYGDIVVVLREDIAPESAKNFKNLVADGFYSGLIFHRVIKDFMLQGGGFTQNFEEKDAASIKGEFASNGFENDLMHNPGVLSMARTTIPDSGSSQFFLMHKYRDWLDGDYAAFGYVLAGMDVVNKIAECETGITYVQGYPMKDVPIEDVVIEEAFFVKLIEK